MENQNRDEIFRIFVIFSEFNVSHFYSGRDGKGKGNVSKKGEQFEVCVIMARVTTSTLAFFPTRVGYQDNVRHRNWL